MQPGAVSWAHRAGDPAIAAWCALCAEVRDACMGAHRGSKCLTLGFVIGDPRFARRHELYCLIKWECAGFATG